jgi:type IV pilus assembly protein PilB
VLAGITSVKEILRLATAPEDFTFRDRIDEDGNLMSIGQAAAVRDSKQVTSTEDETRNTILVIDDSKSIRSLVRFILQAENHDVVEADDGRKGLSLLRQAKDKLSLIIVDYEMPNVDGPTFIHEVRRQSKYDDIPIIMLTSRKDEEDEVLGLDSGADDYIVKPVEPMKLQARVRKMLSMYNRIRM